MKDTAYEKLHSEIVSDLTTELKSDSKFDADILSVKVKNAIKEVIMRRSYENSSYNEEKIANDLERYYSTIRQIALYDYNQVGVEGQISHSENNTSRTWVDREKLFNGVHAFVKVL